MPRATSSVGIGRQVKRETALVSYNDLDATLTGKINDTPPSFEYDTPVSNCLCEFIDAWNIAGFRCQAGMRISRVY